MDPLFRIRQMTKNDLEEAICLSSGEGWNQTEKDWRLLLEGPLNVCIVADDGTKVAGTATAFCYSDEVAWIGMVLVDKALRGQGIGRMLLVDMIGKLNHVSSIKLDSTPAGLPLYKSLGFSEEYNIIRMISPSINDFYFKFIDGEPVHIEADGLTEVLDLDRIVYGADRNYLLKSLYQNYPLKAFLTQHNSVPDGYIFGRDGMRFNYIGPVSAISTASAKALIAKAIIVLVLNNQPIALDILEDKKELIQWLESIGFIRQRFFVRMFLKNNNHAGRVENQFLISGPEFG